MSGKPRSDELPLGLRAPRKGRHELAVERAVRAGQRAGLVEDVDAGTASLARAAARAVDAAERAADPWALARVAGTCLTALVELRLTPNARAMGGSQDDDEPAVAAVVGLGAAARRHAGTAGRA